MKKINNQNGFVSILLAIIILIGIGGGVYFYTKQKSEVKIEETAVTTDVQGTSTVATTTEVNVVSKTKLSDAELLKATEDPQGRILAKGDIDLDGSEDAIVLNIFCGASCGTSLNVVFNKNGKAELLTGPTVGFAPAFYGSSAAKSDIPDITIKDGMVSLTGKGLDCVKVEFYDGNSCDDEGWNIVKTVTYKFDGKNLIQTSVTPSINKSKIKKGIYEFSEFAPSTIGSNQTWVYKLNIKRDGGLGLNSLNIDGFQTLNFFYVNGVASGEGVDIVFDSYGDGNIGTLYKKGDVLFTLKPTINGLGIVWKKMQPNLDSYKTRSVFSLPIN